MRQQHARDDTNYILRVVALPELVDSFNGLLNEPKCFLVA